MPSRGWLIWAALVALPVWALIAAAQSPLLAWREAVYILAGFAGIAGMGLLLFQPLLAVGALPGLRPMRARRLHRWGGALLLGCISVHVAGLWLTSPPDVIDALLFRSPTPFSAYGVIAMWALSAGALLAAFRRRLRRLRSWPLLHGALGLAVAVLTVLHAALIEGAMGQWSKAALSLAVLFAIIYAAWSRLRR